MSERNQEIGRAPGFEGAASATGSQSRSEVGDRLRAARASAGYELGDLAQALRIRLAYLRALEEGRLDDLPGPAYAIGFLRSYSTFLGLDGEAMVRLFKDEVSGLGASAKLVFPAPTEEGKRPTGWLVLVSLVAAAVVYGIWHYLSASERTLVESVSEVPDRLRPAAVESPAPAPSAEEFAAGTAEGEQVGDAAQGPVAASAPAQAAAELGPQAEPATEPAPADDEATANAAGSAILGAAGAAPVPASVAAAEATSAPPLAEESARAVPPAPVPPGAEDTVQAGLSPVVVVAAPDPPAITGTVSGTSSRGEYVPQVYGAGNREARVVVRAQGDSWVQIQGANDELVLTRMLRAGDSYRVPNRDDLVMVTGNAGAIEIAVDGRPIPPLGPLGAVRRNVSLAADSLLARAAASE